MTCCIFLLMVRRRNPDRSPCAVELHNCFIALDSYAKDHAGRLPVARDLDSLTRHLKSYYFGLPELLKRSQRGEVRITWNGRLAGRNLDELGKPGNVWLLRCISAHEDEGDLRVYADGTVRLLKRN